LLGSYPVQGIDVPSIVFVMRRVGNGICLSQSSISGGGLGRSWAVAPQKVLFAPQKGSCATEGQLRHRRAVAPQKGSCATEGQLRHRRAVAPQKGSCATEKTLLVPNTNALRQRAHLGSDSAATVLTSALKSYAVSLSHSTDSVT